MLKRFEAVRSRVHLVRRDKKNWEVFEVAVCATNSALRDRFETFSRQCAAA